MLSEREKEGVRELLQRITWEDLVQLASTVTNRLISVENRQEAVKAIVMYSESAEQFLRRKLVKRDLLFGYLADNSISLSPNAEKRKIIQAILKHWQGREVDRNALEDDSSSEDVCSVAQEAARIKVHVPIASSSAVGSSTSSSSSPTSSASAGQDWCQELADQFSSWFFTQLNLLHPSRPPGSAASEWGPQHFHNNATLILCVIRETDSLTDTYEGAEMVATRLGCLVMEEHLMFNPNPSREGTRGISDPHGLVMIDVCGTIHQAATCVGIFEQKFGLIRDPIADNNWKVKFIKLGIKSGTVQQTPTLETFSQQRAITT